MECNKWSWSPEAVGAIATAASTIVALLVVIAPAVWRRCKAAKLARALFTYDVTSLVVESGALSGPFALRKLREGHWPTVSQKRAAEIPHIREHIGALGLSTGFLEDLAKLLNQCHALRWRLENLSEPDIDYDHGKHDRSALNIENNRAVVLVAARDVHETATRLQTELLKPAWWKICCK